MKETPKRVHFNLSDEGGLRGGTSLYLQKITFQSTAFCFCSVQLSLQACQLVRVVEDLVVLVLQRAHTFPKLAILARVSPQAIMLRLVLRATEYYAAPNLRVL